MKLGSCVVAALLLANAARFGSPALYSFGVGWVLLVLPWPLTYGTEILFMPRD